MGYPQSDPGYFACSAGDITPANLVASPGLSSTPGGQLLKNSNLYNLENGFIQLPGD
jgi:hypothetical protein